MNLLWRCLLVMFFSKFSKSLDIFEESTISFRVLPTDIDFLLHMNNGRYFSLMDLARINAVIRNNIYTVLRRHKIYAVAASEMIRFKKSLNLFKRFHITTRLIAWDNKFFYVVHYFKRRDEIYALSLVKGCFVQEKKGVINPARVLEFAGSHASSPPLPEWVKHWQVADRDFHDMSMDSHKK